MIEQSSDRALFRNIQTHTIFWALLSLSLLLSPFVRDVDAVPAISHTAEKLSYLPRSELLVPAVISEVSSRTNKQYFVRVVHIVGAYGRL